MKFFGTKDIKVFVERIISKRNELKGKIVIDIPAGSGHSTKILQKMGAKVEPYDLFTEFFNVNDIKCKKADLSRELPIKNDYADYVLCQEGIEHLSNQYYMFKEFNRILKKGGVLFLTTPNHSKLRSKLSYLLTESEYFYKIMPPNEIDSIWFSDHKVSHEIYFGHIFLIGIQKLRVLARISGFKIKKVHHLRVNRTSFIILLFVYPLIFLVNLFAYINAIKDKKKIDKNGKKGVYGEILKLGIDPRILVDGHLFIEFEKEFALNETQSILHSKYTDFNIVT